MQIRQVMIFVDDIAAARDFYSRTLGLHIEVGLSEQIGMLIMRNEGCLLTIHGGHETQNYQEGRKVVVASGVE